MKSLWLTVKVMVLLLVCSGLAASDSIELRSGRHIQGKYIGGTASVVGFMTGNTVQYFATADVLALIFDNAEAPMSGASPNPMKDVIPGDAFRENLRTVRKEPRIGKHRDQEKTTPTLVRTRERSDSKI